MANVKEYIAIIKDVIEEKGEFKLNNALKLFPHSKRTNCQTNHVTNVDMVLIKLALMNKAPSSSELKKEMQNIRKLSTGWITSKKPIGHSPYIGNEYEEFRTKTPKYYTRLDGTKTDRQVFFNGKPYYNRKRIKKINNEWFIMHEHFEEVWRKASKEEIESMQPEKRLWYKELGNQRNPIKITKYGEQRLEELLPFFKKILVFLK